jgi:hypothetical protein
MVLNLPTSESLISLFLLLFLSYAVARLSRIHTHRRRIPQNQGKLAQTVPTHMCNHDKTEVVGRGSNKCSKTVHVRRAGA